MIDNDDNDIKLNTIKVYKNDLKLNTNLTIPDKKYLKPCLTIKGPPVLTKQI